MVHTDHTAFNVEISNATETSQSSKLFADISSSSQAMYERMRLQRAVDKHHRGKNTGLQHISERREWHAPHTPAKIINPYPEQLEHVSGKLTHKASAPSKMMLASHEAFNLSAQPVMSTAAEKHDELA